MDLDDLDQLTAPSERTECTPYTYAAWTLDGLHAMYADVMGLSLDDDSGFRQSVLVKYWYDESTDGDRLLEAWLDGVESGDRDCLDLGQLYLMSIIASYCIQAIRAMDTGVEREAWAIMIDARYWMGALYGIQGRRGEPVVPTVSDLARKGADARHAENRQLREFALKHYEQNRSSYRSVEAAAEAIAGRVVPVTQRTVRGWIAAYNKSKQSAGTL